MLPPNCSDRDTHRSVALVDSCGAASIVIRPPFKTRMATETAVGEQLHDGLLGGNPEAKDLRGGG